MLSTSSARAGVAHRRVLGSCVAVAFAAEFPDASTSGPLRVDGDARSLRLRVASAISAAVRAHWDWCTAAQRHLPRERRCCRQERFARLQREAATRETAPTCWISSIASTFASASPRLHADDRRAPARRPGRAYRCGREVGGPRFRARHSPRSGTRTFLGTVTSIPSSALCREALAPGERATHRCGEPEPTLLSRS